MSASLSMQSLTSYALYASASNQTPIEIQAKLVALGYRHTQLSTIKSCLRSHAIVIPSNSPPPLGKGWSCDAERFVFNAHRDRKTVREIWHHLRLHGYAVSEAEVVSCLNAQGIFGVGVTDGR